VAAVVEVAVAAGLELADVLVLVVPGVSCYAPVHAVTPIAVTAATSIARL